MWQLAISGRDMCVACAGNRSCRIASIDRRGAVGPLALTLVGRNFLGVFFFGHCLAADNCHDQFAVV